MQRQKSTTTRKASFVTAMLAGGSLTLLTLFAPITSIPATAQVKDYTLNGASDPKKKPIEGQDAAREAFAERAKEALANKSGATIREEEEKLRSYQPDPVKFPVARNPWDNKPNLSGVYWPGIRMSPPVVALESMYRTTPEVRALRESEEFIQWTNGFENPTFRCYPRSVIDGSVVLGQNLRLIHAPGVLAMIDEEDHRFRIIPIDGRPHNPSRAPSFMGDAVGHWEGDTLVVDVTNFNGRPWLGAPAVNRGDASYVRTSPPQATSKALHIVERWSRPDGRTLDYQAVIEDRTMLTGPWTAPVVRRSGPLKYDLIGEGICQEEPELVAKERAAAAFAKSQQQRKQGEQEKDKR